MNAIALCRRSLGHLHTPPSHRSSFSPRSALAFPQPPPLAAARAAAVRAALGNAFTAVLRRVLQPSDLGLAPVLAPQGELSASLPVSVTLEQGAARVAGYRLLAFYP